MKKNHLSKACILKKSAIVVAHPDDEILWFSSIINKVDKIVIAILEHKSKPSLSTGRKRVAFEYPIENICWLKIDSAEVFGLAKWKNPTINKYGLNISDNNVSSDRYIDNYYKLAKHLRTELKGYKQIFTHNPWGEYGHEEHVQVYRVVKEIQKEMDFNLWFTNYFSNNSCKLMLQYLPYLANDYFTLETNKKLAYDIKVLYERNGSWTWYNEWKWPDHDVFIREKRNEENRGIYGKIYPLNMISFEALSKVKKEKKSKLNKLKIFASIILKFLK